MSRFLDERGRIFGKVNIVDLLVLLVIIAVVVFAVVRMTGDSPQTTKVSVEVTFTVEEVRQATVNALVGALQTGGYVKDDGGTRLGKLVDVVATPTLEQVPTADGELKAVESPIYSDVKVIVEGQGRISDSTVSIGNVPMRVGKKVTLIGTGFEVQTVIMSAGAVE